MMVQVKLLVKKSKGIHKVVYWSTATTGSTDCSLACAAKDANAVVPDADGGLFPANDTVNFGAATGAINGAYVFELTPQENSTSSMFILGHQLKCVLLAVMVVRLLEDETVIVVII